MECSHIPRAWGSRWGLKFMRISLKGGLSCPERPVMFWITRHRLPDALIFRMQSALHSPPALNNLPSIVIEVLKSE